MTYKKQITDEEFEEAVKESIREALRLFALDSEPLEEDIYREHLHYHEIFNPFDPYTCHSVISQAEIEFGEPLRDVTLHPIRHNDIVPQIFENAVQDYLDHWMKEHHFTMAFAHQLHTKFKTLCDDPATELNTPTKIRQHINKWLVQHQQQTQTPLQSIGETEFNETHIRGIEAIDIFNENLMNVLVAWAFDEDILDPRELPDPNDYKTTHTIE